MSDEPRLVRQFGPNRPGNRRGRPKGALNVRTIVEKVALERHKVKKDGHLQRLTTTDLLLHTLRTRALSGDVQAATYLNRIADRLQPDAAGNQGGDLLVPEPLTPEEWVKRHGTKEAEDEPVSGCAP